MSIELYTGTPGSGKSYHAARRIVSRLRRGGGLICNFPVNEGYVKRRKTRVDYWDNSELTSQRLTAYALEHHKKGKEGQTLVVIDECQIKFNCRTFGQKDRNDWIQFFAQHRKLGFNFILITQQDRMIDRQIRGLIETEVKHRKLNNYGIGGFFLSLFTGFSTWFIAIEYWYGGNKLKLSQSMFRYNKKYEKVYDSYRLFSDMAGLSGAGDTAGCPQGRGPAVAPAPAEPNPERKEMGTAVAPPAAAEQEGKEEIKEAV